MVEPNVSVNKPTTTQTPATAQQDEYVEVTTYCCGCIPKKKKVLRSEYSISMTTGNQNELKEKLIQN